VARGLGIHRRAGQRAHAGAGDLEAILGEPGGEEALAQRGAAHVADADEQDAEAGHRRP
jgi:hypothetical protein